MWNDEKQELKREIKENLKSAGLYLVAWTILMIPVMKMFF